MLRTNHILINKLMKERKLSQRKLALAAGFSFHTANKLCNYPQTNASLETVGRLARILQVHPLDLLYDPHAIYKPIPRARTKTGRDRPSAGPASHDDFLPAGL